MYAKHIIYSIEKGKEGRSVKEHIKTSIHECLSIQVEDYENDRHYRIFRKDEDFTIVVNNLDKDHEHHLYVENANGDTIGKY